MNSSQFSISKSEVEFLTPSPITYLLFSFSLLTRGEKSESPEATTKQLMCSFWNDMSIPSTTSRMSAEFLPPTDFWGTSISSMAASWQLRFQSEDRIQSS